MGIFSLFFSFKGRITRGQYWMAAVGQTVALLLLFVVVIESMGLSPAELSAGRSAGNPEILARVGAAGLGLVLGMAVLIWTAAALYTKRLHDRNKGAIWLLAIYIPAALPIIAVVFAREILPATGLISMISGLWMFIELGCLPGTQGPNRFDHGPTSAYLDDAFGKKPEQGKADTRSSLGGMEAAMAAVNAAAREDRRAAPRHPGPATPAQIAQRTAPVFGQRGAMPSAGGFGRRGL